MTKVKMAITSTAGTKMLEILSVRFWIGAWLVWAFFTMSTIWASMVSEPILVALKVIVPLRLIVEPTTVSPTFFTTGILSPVTIDSSIVEEPAVIWPSTGTFSPGLTRIKSPTWTWSSGTLTNWPSFSTSASLAWSPISLPRALEALLCIFSSIASPSRTKTVTKAALSK